MGKQGQKRVDGIKHVFFDLDRTLWDFEKNSETVIFQLLGKYGVCENYVVTPKQFLKKYKLINKELWHLYSHKKISKEELRSTRFTKTLHEIGCNDKSLGLQMEDAYIRLSPFQTHLMEGCFEILDYLAPLYSLHILSNGFKEVQHIKLKNSRLEKYFEHVFVSEDVGHQKPHPLIFEAAMQKAGAKPGECFMVGDDLTNDIKGALQVNWRAAYLSKRTPRVLRKNMFHIKELTELKKIL